MPVEGLPSTETNSQNAATQQQTAATPAATPDAAANNTAANANAGAGTDTAQQNNQAQQQTQQTTDEKRFSQADLDRYLEQRVSKSVQAKLRQLTGEGEGVPTVQELQQQLSDTQARIRSYEAREQVDAFLNDGRNKLSVRPENIRGIQEIVIPRLEYGDDGKPQNMREAVDAAKSIAPALFTNGVSNIDANSGNGKTVAPTNMNDLIRRGAGLIG